MYRKHAYIDEPLPILAGQTISQPTTVAIMTQALEPKKGQKILEIGTGSGYQAGLLSKIVGTKGKVYTVERIPELHKFAKKHLKDFRNVKVILADGSIGYKKKALYDRIIVTAASPSVPKPLFEQLKERGIMILPTRQRLVKVKKVKGNKIEEDLGSFVFVPLIGEFGFK